MKHHIAAWLIALNFVLASPLHAQAGGFEVVRDDIAAAVASALADRGAATKANVIVYGDSNILYRSEEALRVKIQDLTFNAEARRWNATMQINSDTTTLAEVPIQGRYEAVISVPVITRQANSGDVIADSDIIMLDVPERNVRKDTILNRDALIGKSPKRSISRNRPINISELTAPIIIKKGTSVTIQYSAPSMHIHTTGKTLEDGSLWETIRVENINSKRSISARVISADTVEANTQIISTQAVSTNATNAVN
jgi:flagella basal body P-ring formation protein FlgA